LREIKLLIWDVLNGPREDKVEAMAASAFCTAVTNVLSEFVAFAMSRMACCCACVVAINKDDHRPRMRQRNGSLGEKHFIMV